jgi:hypothetical protein
VTRLSNANAFVETRGRRLGSMTRWTVAASGWRSNAYAEQMTTHLMAMVARGGRNVLHDGCGWVGVAR